MWRRKSPTEDEIERAFNDGYRRAITKNRPSLHYILTPLRKFYLDGFYSTKREKEISKMHSRLLFR